MIRRRKGRWAKLASGLYVPPLLHFGPRSPACCCEAVVPLCSRCSGVIPSQFSVTIAGVADDGCSTCDQDVDGGGVNDTYITTWIGAGGTCCIWRYAFNPIICSEITRLSFQVCDKAQYGTVGASISVVLAKANGSTVMWWLKDMGADTFDCDALTAEAMTFQADFGSICDGSSSTCTATAL